MPQAKPELDADTLALPVQAGDALTFWQLGPIEARLFPAPPAAMPPSTRSRFDNAFPDPGDLPCRRHFRATMMGRRIEPPAAIDGDLYALGIGGELLEFSGFWHRPTHLQRFARCVIEVAEAGDYPLELETCGGLRLWADSAAGPAFEPFTRNRPQTRRATLRLEAGRNEILLHMEELAARDTTWMARVVWADARPARALVPAPGGAEALEELRRVALGLRADREGYGGEPIRLLLPAPLERSLAFRLIATGKGNVRHRIPQRQVIVEAGQAVVDLGPARGLPLGYHGFRLDLEVAGMRVERGLALAFTGSEPPMPPAPTLEGRKRQTLAQLAREGDPQIGRALAMAASGGDEAAMRQLAQEAIERIETREDCSDFWMVPLLHLAMTRPATLDRLGLAQRAREVVLGWRYWFDEPGDDVMWFWSENHALCFHTAQYLAGQLHPEATFVNSGRTGRAQERLGRERLEGWFAEVLVTGYVEWHSPAYYPIDAIGLFALEALAGDDAIRKKARQCLDRLFLLTALGTLDGIPSSTQGRSYDRDLKFPALTELAAMARVAWGRGAVNGMAYALPLFCLSGYAPPEGLERLASWPDAKGFEARYRQGAGRPARIVAWKSRDALLGSVVGYHPGEPGYQAVVSQLHLAGHADARVWINHPGQADPFGTRRPSYWAGDGIMPQAAQTHELALLHYRLGADAALPWTHAYARREVFDDYHLDGSWLFLRKGRGLAALFAANGLEAMADGPTAGYELRSPGPANSWLMRAGSVDLFGSLDAFAQAMRRALLEVEPGTRLILDDPRQGRVVADWDGSLSVRGEDRRHCVDSALPAISLDSGGPPPTAARLIA